MCALYPLLFYQSSFKIYQSMWIPLLFYQSSFKICQSMWIQWPIVHTLTIWGQRPQMTLRWHLSWDHMCAPALISLCPSAMKIHRSMGTVFSTYTHCAHFMVPVFPNDEDNNAALKNHFEYIVWKIKFFPDLNWLKFFFSSKKIVRFQDSRSFQ